MVDVVAKTNSVATSVGMKLDAFFSNSLRRAPSNDYVKYLSDVSFALERGHYFERRAAIVDVRIETFVIAKIQFIFEIFHRDAGISRHDCEIKGATLMRRRA
jgi:hypothetical protein